MSSSAQILVGDCVEEMAKMPAESVDTVVTDPPYGLKFMGKRWDDPGAFVERRPDRSVKFDKVGGNHNPCNPQDQVRTARVENQRQQEWHERWAREAFRLLKPGGHLLAFGGTRTYHRMVCAIEDAGFEIRDSVHWVYGSGFPKSLDVSKAIDKMRDDKIAHVCEFLREMIEASEISRKAIGEHFGLNPRQVDQWAPRPTDNSSKERAHIPTWSQWLQLKELLGSSDEMDAEVWRLNGRKGKPGEAWYERELIQERTMVNGGGNSLELRMGERREVEADITAPATEEAQQWQGWGTALKPAHEPICLARKPLSEKNVAQNVLKHGTGAINVDATRVSSAEDTARNRALVKSTSAAFTEGYEMGGNGHAAGRCPPNLLLSHHPDCKPTGEVRRVKGAASNSSTKKGHEGTGCGMGDLPKQAGYADPDGTEPHEVWECVAGCPVREMDRQSGSTPSGGKPQTRTRQNGAVYSEMAETVDYRPYADTRNGGAGASRFFPRFEPELEAPFKYQAKASRRERNAGLVAANNHPTVKPIALMRWLVRLVTPPSGTVLDPFMGSGSTGCAAAVEGVNFIGIEMDAEYAEIARRRIAYHQKQSEEAPLTLEV